jgi:hypothetical protein
MRRPAAPLLAAALALVLAVPAGASSAGGDEPTLRSERVYFACPATNAKVHNAEQAQGRYASWRLTAPTTSFTAGGGCGTVDAPVTSGNPRNAFDAAWTGTFTGNLGRMVVEAHSLDTATRVLTRSSRFTVVVQVDGATVLSKIVTVPYTRSSTQLSQQMVFTVDQLPFVVEQGDGTRQRTVTVAFSSSSDQGAHGFVWDATEVPSGITFNGEVTGEVIVP